MGIREKVTDSKNLDGSCSEAILRLSSWSHHHAVKQHQAKSQGAKQPLGRQSDAVQTGFQIKPMAETITGFRLFCELLELPNVIYKMG